MTTPTNSDDTIDSRDVIARIRELEDERGDLENEVSEQNDRLAEAEGAGDESAERGCGALLFAPFEPGTEVEVGTDVYYLAAEGLRKWPDMPKDYTCGCGLYVHPDSPSLNPAAFHITDCPYFVKP